MPGSTAHITSPAAWTRPDVRPEPASDGVEPEADGGDAAPSGSVPDCGPRVLRMLTASRRIAIWPAAHAHTAIQNDQTATGDGITGKMYLPTVTG
jgi:hypothetical protein